MSESLFSASWYRAASLKPSLRAQARVLRHSYRGQRWHVVQDHATGQFLRFNSAAYAVIALMDGIRTLDDIWRQVTAELKDDAPTQDDILQLLTQLYQANVIKTDRKPDLQEMVERGRKAKWQKLKQYLANPMSLRFPLIDPDKFLTHLVSWIPGGLWQILLLVWLAFIAFSGWQLATSWGELTQDLSARIFTPDNMISLMIIFPLLKAIHELGHGIALKALGLPCREMGVMLLVFMPVPYVDASASLSVAHKGQRALVGAAGMMIELLVAGLALWAWTWVDPGPLKSILHNIVIVSGVTTVVFNANPLLRFDGYYMLSDLLEIPNLGQKANQLVMHHVRKNGFGVFNDPEPSHTRSEKVWMWMYAPASHVYRFMVTTGIALFVAEHYFFIGIVLALWSLWGFAVVPLYQYTLFLLEDARLNGHRLRAMGVSAAALAVVTLAGFAVPLPSGTMAEGVIWMPEESRIRTPVACFGGQILATPGQPVTQGQPLMTCVDPELDAKIAEESAKVEEMRSRVALAQSTDKVQWQIALSGLDFHVTSLRTLRSKSDSRVILSPHDGRFVMPAPSDFNGRYFGRGEVLAHVLDPQKFTLISVVDQTRAELVRQDTQRVELRSIDRMAQVMDARLVREVPAATQDLPSMALSLQGGGQIGLDPKTSGQDHAPKALTPLFQFELAFGAGVLPQALGNRVYIRFVHQNEALGLQLWRSLRQMVMKRFFL